MPDNPPEVISDLVDLAKRHADQHAELYEIALQHGRFEMALRAESAQAAWMEVRRVLLAEVSRLDDSPMDIQHPAE